MRGEGKTPATSVVCVITVALRSLKPNNCKLSDTKASDPWRVVLTRSSVARTVSWDGEALVPRHSQYEYPRTFELGPFLRLNATPSVPMRKS